MRAMDSLSIEFKPMQPEHLAAALRLSLGAGWNQRQQDWELLLRLYPQGAWVACDGDKVVGTVTATNYEGKVGWIGMVLVDPAYQGRGIARRLLHTAIDALATFDTIQLIATPAGRQVYQRLHFQETLTLTRMTGTPRTPSGFPHGAECPRPMVPGDLPGVAAWDARVSGAHRGDVLARLLDLAPEYAWVLERDGHPAGFVLGRHGTHFEHIGPLMAVDLAAAQALAGAMLAKTQGAPVVVDIVDSAQTWRHRLEALGLSYQRPFSRMFLGKQPPNPPLNQCFAIAGPELG